MKSSSRLHHAARVPLAVVVISFALGAASARAAGGVPQPDVYAELLRKAEQGTLRINRGDTKPEPKFFLARMFAPKAKKPHSAARFF